MRKKLFSLFLIVLFSCFLIPSYVFADDLDMGTVSISKLISPSVDSASNKESQSAFSLEDERVSENCPKFEFVLTIQEGPELEHYPVYYMAFDNEGKSELTLIDHQLRFELALYEMIEITMPYDTRFTVEEIPNQYSAEWYGKYDQFLSDNGIVSGLIDEDHSQEDFYCYCQAGILAVSKQMEENPETYNFAYSLDSENQDIQPFLSVGDKDLNGIKPVFDFEVTLDSDSQLLDKYLILYNTEDGLKETFIEPSEDHKLVFSLGFEESFRILLPYDTHYSVEEKEPGYIPQWYDKDWNYIPGAVQGIIEPENSFHLYFCVNPTGALTIQKEYEPKVKQYKADLKEDIQPLLTVGDESISEIGPQFEFLVTLSREDGQYLDEYLTQYKYLTQDGEYALRTTGIKRINDNQLVFKLGYGESIGIGLPYGTGYTVKEIGSGISPEWYDAIWESCSEEIQGVVDAENPYHKYYCVNPAGELSITKMAAPLEPKSISSSSDEFIQPLFEVGGEEITKLGPQFEFTITLSKDNGLLLTEYLVEVMSIENSKVLTLKLNNQNQLIFKIGYGEKVNIRLPYGTHYRVEETEPGAFPEWYDARWRRLNENIEGTIDSNTPEQEYNCINPIGMLSVAKESKAPNTGRPNIPYSNDNNLLIQNNSEEMILTGPEFEFIVTLGGDAPLLKEYWIEYVNKDDEYRIESIEPINGNELIFKLRYGEYAAIMLPIGTSYEIKESEAGYSAEWYFSYGPHIDEPVTGQITKEKLYHEYTCVNQLGELGIRKLNERPSVIPKTISNIQPYLTLGDEEIIKNGPQFNFTVTLERDDGKYLSEYYVVYGADSEIRGEFTISPDENHNLNFTLGYNEAIVICLPYGTKFSINEIEPGYPPEWYNNSTQLISGEVKGEINANNPFQSYFCVNSTGSLIITKEQRAQGKVYSQSDSTRSSILDSDAQQINNSEPQFEFTVTLSREDKNYQESYYAYYESEYDSRSANLILGDGQTLTFRLSFNESITILLPFGTNYSVKEKPCGYPSEWYDKSWDLLKQDVSGLITQSEPKHVYHCVNPSGVLEIYKKQTPPTRVYSSPYPEPLLSVGNAKVTDVDLEFEFVVTLKREDEIYQSSYTAEYLGAQGKQGILTLTPNTKHQLKFKLGFEESIYLSLPYGTEYTVEELSVGYTPSWFDSGANPISGNKISGWIDSEHKSALYYCVNSVGILSITKVIDPSKIPAPPPKTYTSPNFQPLMSLGDIKITDSNPEFEFVVTLAHDDDTPFDECQVIYGNGQVEKIKLNDGKLIFTLGIDETIKLVLPFGTKFIIEEPGYEPRWFKSHEFQSLGRVEGTFQYNYFSPNYSFYCFNELTDETLTVSKVVADGKTTNKVFKFRVNVKPAITGNYGDMKFRDGVAEFTLKNGESKTAKYLPVGFDYTVEEIDSKGCIPEYSRSDYYKLTNLTDETILPKWIYLVEDPDNTPPQVVNSSGKIVSLNPEDISQRLILNNGKINDDWEIEEDVLKTGKFKVRNLPGFEEKQVEIWYREYYQIQPVSEEKSNSFLLFSEGENTYCVKLNYSNIQKPFNTSENIAKIENNEYRYGDKLTLRNDNFIYFSSINRCLVIKKGNNSDLELYQCNTSDCNSSGNYPVKLIDQRLVANVDGDNYYIKISDSTPGSGSNGKIELVTDPNVATVFKALSFEKFTVPCECVVTNTLPDSEPVGDLTVTKTVRIENGELTQEDNNKKFSFTVELTDKTINRTYTDMTFENGVASFELTNGQSATAKGLPADIGYTVTETPSPGYTADKNNVSGTISEEGPNAVQIVNTRTDESEVGKTEIAKNDVPIQDLQIDEKTGTVTGPLVSASTQDKITYKIYWNNIKPDQNDAITIIDELDPGVDFISASSDMNDTLVLNSPDLQITSDNQDIQIIYDKDRHLVTWKFLNGTAHINGSVKLVIRVNDKARQLWGYDQKDNQSEEGEVDQSIVNRANIIGNTLHTTNEVENPIEGIYIEKIHMKVSTLGLGDAYVDDLEGNDYGIPSEAVDPSTDQGFTGKLSKDTANNKYKKLIDHDLGNTVRYYIRVTNNTENNLTNLIILDPVNAQPVNISKSASLLEFTGIAGKVGNAPSVEGRSVHSVNSAPDIDQDGLKDSLDPNSQPVTYELSADWDENWGKSEVTIEDYIPEYFEFVSASYTLPNGTEVILRADNPESFISEQGVTIEYKSDKNIESYKDNNGRITWTYPLEGVNSANNKVKLVLQPKTVLEEGQYDSGSVACRIKRIEYHDGSEILSVYNKNDNQNFLRWGVAELPAGDSVIVYFDVNVPKDGIDQTLYWNNTAYVQEYKTILDTLKNNLDSEDSKFEEKTDVINRALRDLESSKDDSEVKAYDLKARETQTSDIEIKQFIPTDEHLNPFNLFTLEELKAAMIPSNRVVERISTEKDKTPENPGNVPGNPGNPGNVPENPGNPENKPEIPNTNVPNSPGTNTPQSPSEKPQETPSTTPSTETNNNSKPATSTNTNLVDNSTQTTTEKNITTTGTTKQNTITQTGVSPQTGVTGGLSVVGLFGIIGVASITDYLNRKKHKKED